MNHLSVNQSIDITNIVIVPIGENVVCVKMKDWRAQFNILKCLDEGLRERNGERERVRERVVEWRCTNRHRKREKEGCTESKRKREMGRVTEREREIWVEEQKEKEIKLDGGRNTQAEWTC